MNFLKVFCLIVLQIVGSQAHLQVCLNHTSLAVDSAKATSQEVFNQLFIDPIHIEHLELSFEHPLLSGNLTLSELVIIIEQRPDSLRQSDLISWHLNIEIVGKYDLDGNLGGLFDVFGVGPAWLRLTDFFVHVPMNVTSYLPLCITFEVFVTVQKFESQLYDLMNDEELGDLVNMVLRKLGPEMIPEIWQEMKDFAEPYIQKIIDSIFNNNLGVDKVTFTTIKTLFK